MRTEALVGSRDGKGSETAGVEHGDEHAWHFLKHGNPNRTIAPRKAVAV